MIKPLTLAAVLLSACGSIASAQFAPSNAAPAFTAPATSTMGSIIGNSLVVTPLVNGFVVNGQVQISLAAAPVSGILVEWTVERQVDPAFTASGIKDKTTLTGFSAPPGGTFATTSGTVQTD